MYQMRSIKHIVIHCTATQQSAKIESIKRYWKETLGWKSPGYHFIIEPSGYISQLHPIEKPTNGVRGYNSNAIHLSYIGGVDEDNKPIDNRTDEQIESMVHLVESLKDQFPDAKILGHRDFPNVNKACPSFDVYSWLNEYKLNG